MKIDIPKSWPVDTGGAIAVQNRLRHRVVTTDQFDSIITVAGIDAGFEQEGSVTRAAVVVLQLPELTLLEQAIAYRPTSFPYVPSLLSFREMPTVLDALTQLTIAPDLILCDGAGIAHPRRLGIASHLGVLIDKPTIGVAKSRLIGTYDELPLEKGAWVPLCDRGEQIGAVLRSRTDTKPLFVSAGHRISLETAVDYVLQCTPKFRLPETTRLADRLASNRGPMPTVGTSVKDGVGQMELF